MSLENENILSPLQPEPAPLPTTGELLAQHQADTAGQAALEILKLIGTTDNLFLVSQDPEAIKKADKAYENALAEILVILAKYKVGTTNYPFIFNGIKSVVDGIFQTVQNHTSNLKVELISRAVGAKNPINGKFDIDHATHEDLINSVLKVREATGDNPEDFFTMVNK